MNKNHQPWNHSNLEVFCITLNSILCAILMSACGGGESDSSDNSSQSSSVCATFIGPVAPGSECDIWRQEHSGE